MILMHGLLLSNNIIYYVDLLHYNCCWRSGYKFQEQKQFDTMKKRRKRQIKCEMSIIEYSHKNLYYNIFIMTVLQDILSDLGKKRKQVTLNVTVTYAVTC